MSLLLVASFCLGAIAGAPFRPPSTPLLVLSPYTSVWSPWTHLADNDTQHWNGAPIPLYSAVRIDGGVPLALMGATGLAPAEQLGLARVTPTSSIFTFGAGGVVLNLTFTTPFVVDEDLETHVRPAAYVTWTALSSDGGSHTVDVLYAQGGGLVARFDNRSVTWSRGSLLGATPPLNALVLSMAAADQFSNITSRAWHSHEDDRADFGAFHLVAASGAGLPSPSGCFVPLNTALAALTTNGSVGCMPAADAQPPARVDEGVLAAVSWTLTVTPGGGAAAAAAGTARLTYFADEVVGLVAGGQVPDSIEIIPPYWRRNLPTPVDGPTPYQLPVAEVAGAVAAAPVVNRCTNASTSSVGVSPSSARKL